MVASAVDSHFGGASLEDSTDGVRDGFVEPVIAFTVLNTGAAACNTPSTSSSLLALFCTTEPGDEVQVDLFH